MTIAAKPAMPMATPTSTERCVGPAPCDCSLIASPEIYPCRGCKPTRNRRTSLPGKEARLFHERLVALLFGIDPLGVVGTDHEGGIEGALVHQLLPLRRLTHLPEQAHVIVDHIL